MTADLFVPAGRQKLLDLEWVEDKLSCEILAEIAIYAQRPGIAPNAEGPPRGFRDLQDLKDYVAEQRREMFAL